MMVAEAGLEFGLMLSNRGPVVGYATPRELVELGVAAERSGAFDSVWSGDAFLVNPRLDAINLLSAVAAQTERVQLGPSCMGSFTQRNLVDLAYSWASLDCLSEGRSLMVACVGGGSVEAWDRESQTTRVPSSERRQVMWERIDVLRRLWSQDEVYFSGRYHRLDGVSISPRPVRQPYPMWAATNITRLASGSAEGKLPVKTLGILGSQCDGWMTHSVDAGRFDAAWQVLCDAALAAGRDVNQLDNCLCMNVCVNEDAEAALDESVAFLHAYYGIAFTRERTRAWTACGPPEACAEKLRSFKDSAVKRIALRITSNQQLDQFKRVVEEVLPLV